MSECPQCLGSTWKRESVPDKRDPSRLRTVAVRCDCFLEARQSSLLKAARIPERYSGGLDEYQAHFAGADPSLESAKMFAMEMVRAYPIEKTGLLFVGRVGIGKTHLASAVLRELIVTKGATGLFYSYADLLTEIRDTYSDNGAVKFFKDEDGNRWETESQILNHVINVDVLLLDELGKVKASEWVLDKVREIIGGRYDKKGTTLITTNFPLDPRQASEISLQEKIGADMVSRLREMCRLVRMEGVDFRHNQKAVNLPDSTVGRT